MSVANVMLASMLKSVLESKGPEILATIAKHVIDWLHNADAALVDSVCARLVDVEDREALKRMYTAVKRDG